MQKFKVNDRVYLPRVLNGVPTEVQGKGTVQEVTTAGYMVLFDWGATIGGLQDGELELVISE